MIYTSRYSNRAIDPTRHAPVRITVGAPRFPLKYALEGVLPDLAPYGCFGIEDRDEFEAKYRARLDRKGVEPIARCLADIEQRTGRDVLLLCFEDLRKPTFCHRTMFAEWWLERTGEVIEELG